MKKVGNTRKALELSFGSLNIAVSWIANTAKNNNVYLTPQDPLRPHQGPGPLMF